MARCSHSRDFLKLPPSSFPSQHLDVSIYFRNRCCDGFADMRSTGYKHSRGLSALLILVHNRQIYQGLQEMWQGVRTYVDGVVEDHILHELCRINPNLDQQQKKRLREMVRRASHLATGGDSQQALIQLRSCLMLSVRGIQDPDVLSAVQSLVEYLPYSRFEEPVPQSEETLSIPEIDEELRFMGIDSPQVSRLSLERRRALMQPDIVAIFEEERANSVPYNSPSSSTSAQGIASRATIDGDSAILLVEQDIDSLSNSSNDVEEWLSRPESGTFRFATSVFDSAFTSSRDAIRMAVNGVKKFGSVISLPNIHSMENEDSAGDRGSFGSRDAQILINNSSDDGQDQLGLNRLNTKLPPSIWTNPKVSVEQITQTTSPTGRTGWAITKRSSSNLGRHGIDNTCPTSQVGDAPYSVVDSDHGELQQKQECASSRSLTRRKQPILIRCHFFKGGALKEWFDLGHVSNPVTRSTVMMEDWCRLTNVTRKEVVT